MLYNGWTKINQYTSDNSWEKQHKRVSHHSTCCSTSNSPTTYCTELNTGIIWDYKIGPNYAISFNITSNILSQSGKSGAQLFNACTWKQLCMSAFVHRVWVCAFIEARVHVCSYMSIFLCYYVSDLSWLVVLIRPDRCNSLWLNKYRGPGDLH